MLLSGDDNIPAMPVSKANVNHLRRLLAWMRTEYCLDEHGQRGVIIGLSKAVEHGHATSERATELLQQQASEIHKVPAYVRQAVKMLTAAIRAHDKQSGVINQEGLHDGA